jgi:hypothetical protein
MARARIATAMIVKRFLLPIIVLLKEINDLTLPLYLTFMRRYNNLAHRKTNMCNKATAKLYITTLSVLVLTGILKVAANQRYHPPFCRENKDFP